MDKLNLIWLKGKTNFYFYYKRNLLESMIEGSCLNVGCGSHIIKDAVNIDEGLPNLDFEDESFDTVICSDVLEHLGPYKQALEELFRVAKKKVILTVPAYKWLYGKYDRLLGHKRRYSRKDFPGFEVEFLFWFLVPILFLRKIFGLRHRNLPILIDRFFFFLSHIHLNFGTTILACKNKIPTKLEREHRVSLFIPILNEEKTLERSIKTLDSVIKKIPLDYEIFIVNDASSDSTAKISEKISESNRNIKLLNYNIGPTRRENLAQSFKEARGDIIAFLDIDVIASLRFLRDLVGEVMLGNDIVTGSRYLKSSKTKRKPHRIALSVPYNLLIRFIFKTGIRDHMCGFKAFKRDVIFSLVEEMGYDKSLKRGIFWDTELLVRGLNREYNIKEIPIWWTERNESRLSFKREIKAIGYILKFIIRFKRGKM